MPFNVKREREITRATCLRHFAGRESIKSGVFDATTLTEVGGFFQVPIGTFLTASVASDPTKVKAYQALGANANDVQTVSTTGVPTGGTFTLTFNGATTAGIKFNATAAEVAAALAALSTIAAGTNVKATGGALPTAVVVTFEGLLGNKEQPLMTANGAGLTGGATPTATVVHTTPGTSAEKIIGVFDGPQRDFFGNSAAADMPIPIYYHTCAFDVSKLQNWNLYGAAAMLALPTCEFY